jgi:hypothetical protein
MALAFRSSFMTWLKAMRGRVVDADVDELPANAEAAVDHAFSSSGYPVAHRADPAELLDVDVDELAWVRALVSQPRPHDLLRSGCRSVRLGSAQSDSGG